MTKKRLARRKILQLISAGVLAVPVGLASHLRVASAEVAAAKGKDASPFFWKKVEMDVMTAIFTRRSHRSYTGEPVAKEDLKAILAAGMQAPSAKDQRPWHFVVLQEKASLRLIAQSMSLMGYVQKAGAAILVCVDTREHPGAPLAFQSVPMCCQNMWLALTGLGYGGVWAQIYPSEESMDAWKQMAGLPKYMAPLCFMLVGKTDVPIPAENRFDASRIHYEKW